MDIFSDKISKSTVVMTLSGRLDAANAPLLDRKVKQVVDEISELILDFSDISYISSMGLRVLLHAQKAMNERKGHLVIKNMHESVREVFAMAGFLHLMVQEERFVIVRKDDHDYIMLSLHGEIKNEDIASIAKELSKIKEQKLGVTAMTVILDMENITHISPNALKHLKEAINETAWDGRKLQLQNASVDIKAALREAGLEHPA